jgi:bifunctional non-homologous end joining protein LigD
MDGLEFVDHLQGEGAIIFAHACNLGFEGIVSKRRDRPYRYGPSKTWIKVKNPKAPGVLRFEERE